MITLGTRGHNQALLRMGETVLPAARLLCAIFGILMSLFPTDHPACTALIVTVLGGLQNVGLVFWF